MLLSSTTFTLFLQGSCLALLYKYSWQVSYPERIIQRVHFCRLSYFILKTEKDDKEDILLKGIDIYFNALKFKVSWFLVSLIDIVLVFPGKPKRAILYKKCENYSDDLILSTSGSSKQEVEGKSITVIQTCEGKRCVPIVLFLFTIMLNLWALPTINECKNSRCSMILV